MIDITRTEDVFVLRMVADENRFNPTMLDAFDGALSEVEASEGPAAVVLTGEGKFFSNGLDLEWMMANLDEGGPALVANGLQALYRRLVTFPDGDRRRDQRARVRRRGHARARLRPARHAHRAAASSACRRWTSTSRSQRAWRSSCRRSSPRRPPTRRCSRAGGSAPRRRSRPGSSTRPCPRTRCSRWRSSAPRRWPASRAPRSRRSSSEMYGDVAAALEETVGALEGTV